MKKFIAILFMLMTVSVTAGAEYLDADSEYLNDVKVAPLLQQYEEGAFGDELYALEKWSIEPYVSSHKMMSILIYRDGDTPVILEGNNRWEIEEDDYTYYKTYMNDTGFDAMPQWTPEIATDDTSYFEYGSMYKYVHITPEKKAFVSMINPGSLKRRGNIDGSIENYDELVAREDRYTAIVDMHEGLVDQLHFDVYSHNILYKMTFNGAEVLSKERFTVDGRTYVNMRDIAHIYDKFVLAGGENEVIISDTLPAEASNMEEVYYFDIPFYNTKDMREQLLEPLAGLSAAAGGYYPRLIYVTEERWREVADITCLFFSLEMPWRISDESPYYMPREVFEKFHSRLVLPPLTVNGSQVKVTFENKEYTLSCIAENGEVYVPVRELAEVFGFDVSFENEVVTLVDSSVDTSEPPSGLDLYYIDGVEFLREVDVRPIIEAKGLEGAPVSVGNNRIQVTANGYCIFGFPPGKTGFAREAVPYVNLAFPDGKSWNGYLMYEYFEKTETFPELLY